MQFGNIFFGREQPLNKPIFLVAVVGILLLVCPLFAQEHSSGQSLEKPTIEKQVHQSEQHGNTTQSEGDTQLHEGNAAAVHIGLGEVLPLWSVLPFIGILLSIAIFPLMAPVFWHHNFGKISADRKSVV